jgi:hypothetical protein
MDKVASLPWFSHKQDTSIYKRGQGDKKTHYTCVQKAFKSHPKRCGEPSCLDLLTGRDQSPSNSCSPTASPYLHTRRQERPSLGSQRVSKHVIGNPRFGHTGKWCTQPIMWVSMMQMPVGMKSLSNTLGTMLQRSHSRRKSSATTSKKAKILRGRRRRTNTSTMGSMSRTNTRNTRSMSTSMA